MKRYLNRQEKNDFYILAAFMIFMEDSIATWEKVGKDKELLKSARTCRTYANKVATMFISTLDDLEKTKLLTDCKKFTVTAMLRSEYDLRKKQKGIVPVNEEDLKDITDHALIVCQTCSETGDQVDGCHLRDILMSYDIPPFDEHAPIGSCQYKIPDWSNRTEVIRGLLKGA